MLALLALSVTLLVKAWKSELLPLLRIALSLLFAGAALGASAPLVAYLKELTGQEGVAQYATVLLKALGISVLTQCCSELCRECGESGIAEGVELVGKTEILLLCLPLMGEIIKTAGQWLSLGAS